ncbi:MAG: TlpA disulfide reductase family protein [Bryobacteraceae bacterium]|jgi:thiol-disulfide isomerase/thioredoxin
MNKAALLVTAVLVSLSPAFSQTLPRQAPEQIIHFAGGKTAKVSDYTGKVVLVAFILTGCPHCQHTVTLLNGIQMELGDRGFQAIALAVDEDAAQKLAEFNKTLGPAFPVGYCPGADARGFLQLTAGKRTLAPLLAFLDRKGMIRFQTDGSDAAFFNDQEADHIRAQVLKLLATPASGHAQKATKKP